MGLANKPTPPPGASTEGVGRGWCGRVLFNSPNRPRKKLITILNNIFTFIYFICTLLPPKWWNNSPSAHSCPVEPPLHFLFPYAEYSWLVVVWLFADWQPIYTAVFFFIIFALLHLTSKMMGQRPPTRSKPHAPPLSFFPTLTVITTLGWLLWLGHFKATNEPFSLNFWACVASRSPNKPTNGGAAKPYHGRLAWDHRRPRHHVVWVPLTYPRRQRAKPLGGRAVAAHVGCCVVCVLCW